MSARKSAPVLKRHRSTGHAYARFEGQQFWFGNFDEAEAHIRFATFLARWEANGRTIPDEGNESDGVTVQELVALYLRHAEVYYRRLDGTQTHEVVNVRQTVRPLLKLYSQLPAAEFRMRTLKQLREEMIDSGLARLTDNNRIGRVVRIFGWGVEEEFVPPEVFGALRALKSLKRGRSRAPETDPITPVSWSDVEAVLDRVPAPVASMILLQWHTGMRPGEVVCLKPSEIDRTGEVWIYTPGHHKTEHHGRLRVIGIGPQGQAVISPSLMRIPKPDPDKSLFSPVQAMADRHAKARAGRKTPLWPSHQRSQAKRRAARQRASIQETYTVDTYRRAITRACKLAKVDQWSPNRLRHSAATRIRKELGLEAARVVLGHSSSSMTEIYAELDQRKALEAMAKLG